VVHGLKLRLQEAGNGSTFIGMLSLIGLYPEVRWMDVKNVAYLLFNNMISVISYPVIKI
jgi:hypothetical protein